MTFADLLRGTLGTLRSHLLRTALTMFGIAWGIVSITLMVAAGEGLRVGQAKVAEGFGKDLMIVFPGRTGAQAGGTAAGRRLLWDWDDYRLIKEGAPACGEALPELGQQVRVKSEFHSGSWRVTGSLPPFQNIRSIPIASGRFYTDADQADGRRVVVLGSEVREQLFPSADPIGRNVTLNGITYSVIGTMRSKDQDSDYDGQDVEKLFAPFSAVARDFPNLGAGARSVDQMLVTPRSLETHETCKVQVRAVLAAKYHFDPRDEDAVPIWDTVEEAKAFALMTGGMKRFLGGVGFTTLLLGGLGVMNVMLVAVRERTREIGIRMAVGATPRSIVTQFFIEAAILVTVSGAVGLGAAYGICALVDLMPMPMYFAGLLPTPAASILALVFLGTIALGSAIYPAAQAASIDPIDALRREPGG